MSDSDAPMTNADWLRASAGWVDGKQFDMLDARYLEESADEIESLRADNDRLREALEQAAAELQEAANVLAGNGFPAFGEIIQIAAKTAHAKAISQ